MVKLQILQGTVFFVVETLQNKTARGADYCRSILEINYDMTLYLTDLRILEHRTRRPCIIIKNWSVWSMIREFACC